MFDLSSNFQEQTGGKQKKAEWRFFHVKDPFQSLMQPCFIFCRILGIFPYKINDTTFEISKPHHILSIVAVCVCNICSLIIVCGSSFFGKINMLILPAILGNNFALVLGNFIMIVMIILTGPRMRLLQTISKIFSRLPSESQKLSRLIHAKDIIGFLYLFGLILIWFYMLQIDQLLDAYIKLVIFQMDMLHMNCVCVLKACFTRINDNLASMKRLIANNEPHVSRLNYSRNQFLIMELKALQKQHLAINDTVRMLNVIFSLQLLATVVVTFSAAIVNAYYYILSWEYLVSSSSSTKVLNQIYSLLEMAYLFGKIGMTVWACETGNQQARQIGTSVHDVFNSITDEQIRYELQLFSLQVLHCDNRFSAKGLTVDAKLFVAIVNSIVIYIILLFQFKLMPYSCEEQTTNNNTQVI